MTQETKALLNVARRETLGKKVKALRRGGAVPANIYGRHVDSLAVQVQFDDLRHLLRHHNRNDILYVQVDGQERPTFIRDVQRHPVSDKILHVDFLQISLTEKVRMEVPIHIVGKAPAVETYGGILTHPSTHIMVEALPLQIPNMLEIDVSGLTEIGQTLHSSDLIAPEGVAIVSDVTLVRVDLPAAERAEEAVAAEGAVEAAEGAAAEGAAPAAEGEKKEE
ncbi:MAG TPA: 50S ribosomal protein L25 [Dehalococcoidia bacterium]|jgi:large subunit ribosomal protein L25|nr:50S ribosomal protein L25 [Dehalococcoidia bacterium]